ncbi:hypothetical protein [Variovorax sp. GT1P44]|uniref:hypothetical protein n=1 Tax=Variovorax sp. GT1P44 TaxID=3443742 RepID=UPI003F467F16
MTSPFNWRSLPSQTVKALQPHKGNKKPGAPITLNGSNPHGGAYSKAIPSDEQVRGMDSTFGGL